MRTFGAMTFVVPPPGRRNVWPEALNREPWPIDLALKRALFARARLSRALRISSANDSLALTTELTEVL
jgi:hypothetical protein